MSTSVVHRYPPCILAVTLTMSLAMTTAHATRPKAIARPDPAPATATTPIERARAAWAAADFETAEGAYQDVIDQGGLAKADVVEAYTHLAVCEWIVGKHDAAAANFRMAAIVEPAFQVPTEAGKKAAALAETVRKQSVPLALVITAPKSTDSGKSFPVDVALDAAEVPLLAHVRLIVRDPSTSKETRLDETPQAVVHFVVPASATLPNSALTLRTLGLDARGNELIVAESQTRISSAIIASAPIVKDEHKSFWKTPWPYLIGGAVLAGGAVGTYFAVRQPSEISVGAPRVQAN